MLCPLFFKPTKMLKRLCLITLLLVAPTVSAISEFAFCSNKQYTVTAAPPPLPRSTTTVKDFLGRLEGSLARKSTGNKRPRANGGGDDDGDDDDDKPKRLPTDHELENFELLSPEEGIVVIKVCGQRQRQRQRRVFKPSTRARFSNSNPRTLAALQDGNHRWYPLTAEEAHLIDSENWVSDSGFWGFKLNFVGKLSGAPARFIDHK